MNIFFFFAAQTTTYSEAACEINSNEVIHPFAFRVHTHGLGRVVSGWKVTKDMQWTLLGKVLRFFYTFRNEAYLFAHSVKDFELCNY